MKMENVRIPGKGSQPVDEGHVEGRRGESPQLGNPGHGDAVDLLFHQAEARVRHQHGDIDDLVPFQVQPRQVRGSCQSGDPDDPILLKIEATEIGQFVQSGDVDHPIVPEIEILKTDAPSQCRDVADPGALEVQRLQVRQRR